MHAIEDIKPGAVLACPFCNDEIPRRELPSHLVFGDYLCMVVLGAVGYECPCCQKGYDLDFLASACCPECEEPCSPDVRWDCAQHALHRARHFLRRMAREVSAAKIHDMQQLPALLERLDRVCEMVPQWVDDINSNTVQEEVEAALPLLRTIVDVLAVARRKQAQERRRGR